MKDIDSLQKSLGVDFSDISLLQQSLVHRSYLNENPGFALGSNERLEFLGDALIGYVVAESLYNRFCDLAEGDLTRLRAAIVSRDALANLASTLCLGEYLYLSRGEEASGGRRRPANLACVFEAVVGAILLDCGPEAAKDFVLRTIEAELTRVLAEDSVVDHKSRLQELVQAKGRFMPTYRILHVSGPEHSCEFTAEVLVDGVVMGRGKGRSKRRAEKEAARAALEAFQ